MQLAVIIVEIEQWLDHYCLCHVWWLNESVYHSYDEHSLFLRAVTPKINNQDFWTFFVGISIGTYLIRQTIWILD
jgi:hypothetical protein